MTHPLDEFALAQSAERRAAVRSGSKASHEKRTDTLFADYDDPDRLRRLAGEIKQHTLDHLDHYLELAESQLLRRGAPRLVPGAYPREQGEHQCSEDTGQRDGAGGETGWVWGGGV